MTTELETLGLPNRITNPLRRAGIHSVETLAAMSKTDLLKLRCIWHKSVREIETALKPFSRGGTDNLRQVAIETGSLAKTETKKINFPSLEIQELFKTIEKGAASPTCKCGCWERLKEKYGLPQVHLQKEI